VTKCLSNYEDREREGEKEREREKRGEGRGGKRRRKEISFLAHYFLRPLDETHG